LKEDNKAIDSSNPIFLYRPDKRIPVVNSKVGSAKERGFAQLLGNGCRRRAAWNALGSMSLSIAT